MIVYCPNCKKPILLESLNCNIFRHGVFKSNLQQMNPHETKENCMKFKKEKIIYGCGKPFTTKIIKNKLKAIKCDYI